MIDVILAIIMMIVTGLVTVISYQPANEIYFFIYVYDETIAIN